MAAAITLLLSLLAWPVLGYLTALLAAVNYVIIVMIIRFVENRACKGFDGWDGYEFEEEDDK